jgi:hypothetical protein
MKIHFGFRACDGLGSVRSVGCPISIPLISSERIPSHRLSKNWIDIDQIAGG